MSETPNTETIIRWLEEEYGHLTSSQVEHVTERVADGATYADLLDEFGPTPW